MPEMSVPGSIAATFDVRTYNAAVDGGTLCLVRHGAELRGHRWPWAAREREIRSRASPRQVIKTVKAVEANRVPKLSDIPVRQLDTDTRGVRDVLPTTP